jgi:hypothetical protein|nr:MAG TPA: hypothetical protein [Podoviridae sp. ct13o21]
MYLRERGVKAVEKTIFDDQKRIDEAKKAAKEMKL